MTIGAGSNSITTVNGKFHVLGGGEHCLEIQGGYDTSLLIKGGGGESWLAIQNTHSSTGDTNNAWKIGTDDDKILHFRWGRHDDMGPSSGGGSDWLTISESGAAIFLGTLIVLTLKLFL